MEYNTIYVGMDVHKESFTLCSYTIKEDRGFFVQRMDANYKSVLNYFEHLRANFGEDIRIVCGYEAGCLGFSLYKQLTAFNVECIILAPSTMLEQRSKKRIKTDKRDAELIARCLATHSYSPVHVPTETDEYAKEYLRMRKDHLEAFKAFKQQILSFCLRHNICYSEGRNWTERHVEWLLNLELPAMLRETLNEYLITFTQMKEKLARFDEKIEEMANNENYKDSVEKLRCFNGINTKTALAVVVEIGDFKRFASAKNFASYIGLVPDEDSSGDRYKHGCITKAGNSVVRTLLVESAQSYSRGMPGIKSSAIKAKQAGNSAQVIAYADRANERLKRKYNRLAFKENKNHNVAKVAVARELACFVWGMLTDNIA